MIRANNFTPELAQSLHEQGISFEFPSFPDSVMLMKAVNRFTDRMGYLIEHSPYLGIAYTWKLDGGIVRFWAKADCAIGYFAIGYAKGLALLEKD